MGEYEEFVKKIPAAERVPEPFTGIDNRLDFLGPKIVDMRERLGKVEYTLSKLELPEGVAMPQKIEQIPFFYDLEKPGTDGSQALLTEIVPFSGYIKQVTPHWPDGCDGNVEVRVGHGNKQFCPKEGFLALNDATPTYPFNESVSGGNEEIWVEMINGDSANKHAITVTVMLEGAAS